MNIYSTVHDIEQATLVTGDTVRILGERVEGDGATMTGRVRADGSVIYNRVVYSKNNLPIEIFPVPATETTKEFVEGEIHDFHTDTVKDIWRAEHQITSWVHKIYQEGEYYIPKTVPFITATTWELDKPKWVVLDSEASTLRKVFGSTPVDLVTGLQLVPVATKYTLLFAFGAVYELPNNTETYSVTSFVKDSQDNCVITLANSSTVTAIKVSMGSQYWVEVAAKVIAEGGTVPREFSKHFGDIVNIMDYAPIVNGSVDNTEAFQKVASIINAKGGGTVLIPANIYRAGKQSTDATLFRKAEPVLKFENCTKPITVICGGATIKVNDDLYFGAFNPATGERYNHSSASFTDSAYRADAYDLIEANNCESFHISDLNIDGNGANCKLGGLWGDKGRQCRGTGVITRNCKNVMVKNVITTNNLLDGIAVSGFTSAGGTNIDNQATLINVFSDTNGRQGCSITASKGTFVTGSHFKNTGRLVHKSGEVISSAPNSGFDLEAEGGAFNRRAYIINSTFTNNAGTGFVADSGDSSDIIFDGCLFYSPDNIALWPNKPNIIVRNCTIVGQIVSIYKGTRFEGCYITDKLDAMQVASVHHGKNLIDTAGSGAFFEKCKFEINYMRLGNFATMASNPIPGRIVDCTLEVKTGTEYLANREFLLIIARMYTENLVIIQNIQGTAPVDAYYIEIGELFDYPFRVNGDIRYSSPTDVKIRWGSYSAGGGTTGFVDTNAKYLYVNTQSHRATYYGQTKIGSSSVLPTAGHFTKGDVMYNSNPAVDGYMGWTCITSSTNGTGAVFKPFGKIEA